MADEKAESGPGELRTTERREVRQLVTRTTREFDARLTQLVEAEQDRAREDLWQRTEVQELAKVLEVEVNGVVADFARKAQKRGFRLEPRDADDFEAGFRLVATPATFRALNDEIAKKYRFKRLAIEKLRLRYEQRLVPSAVGQEFLVQLRKELEDLFKEE